jgi:hypothetical protein
VRALIWWICWGAEAVTVVLCAVVAPVVAIISFATGDAHKGLIGLAFFAGALVYGLLLAYRLIDTPWRSTE